MSPKTNTNEKLISNQQSSGVSFGRGKYSVNTEDDIWQTLLGYRRFKDFDSSNANGQDFALIGHNKIFAIGVIADGVSQSFFGDIAAKEVCENLYEYLWENRDEFPEKQQVEEFLYSICSKVDNEISAINLNKYDSILQKALSETKRKGSQTVFSAFIINLITKQSIFYTVGDIEVVVYQKVNTKLIPKKVSAANANGRWSSAGKSELLLDVEKLENVVGIVAYSDGLVSKNLSDWGENFNYAKLFEFCDLAEEESGRDDVSFISVLTNDLLDKNSSQKFDFSKIPVFVNQPVISDSKIKLPKSKNNHNDELNNIEETEENSKQQVRAKQKKQKKLHKIFVAAKNKISNNKAYFLMGIFVCIILIGIFSNLQRLLNLFGFGETNSNSSSSQSVINNSDNRNDFDNRQNGFENNSISENSVTNLSNNGKFSNNSQRRANNNQEMQRAQNNGSKPAGTGATRVISNVKPTITPTVTPSNKNNVPVNETRPTETPKSVETPKPVETPEGKR